MVVKRNKIFGLGVLACASYTLAQQSEARAQAFDSFEISVSVHRSEFAAGRPQVVDIAPTNTSGFAPGPGSLWSVYSFGFADGVVFEDESLDPAVHNFNENLVTLTPAQSAYDFTGGLSFQREADFISFVSDAVANGDVDALAGLDIQEECFGPTSTRAMELGISIDSYVHSCDAIDLRVGLDALDLRVSGSENNPNLTFQIASVGYSFSSSLVADRSDAWDQFADDFLASPQADALAARLLGVNGASAGVTPGELPDGGDLFAIRGSITDATTGAVTEESFGFSSFSEIVAYALINRDASAADFGYDDFVYHDDCFRDAGDQVTGVCDAVDVTISVFGVDLRIQSIENSPDFTFTLDQAGVAYTSESAPDRDDSAQEFIDYLTTSGAADDVVAALLAGVSVARPDDPLVGNPQSLQGNFNTALLNLDAPSDVLGETGSSEGDSGPGGRAVDPPGWMIGGRIGTFNSGRMEADFVEAVVERGWRLGEGRRSRVKFSAPFTYTEYSNDMQQSTAAARLSLEMPLREGRWVIEPSVGAGYFFETDEFGSGALYSLGVSSRYKIAPVGRGHIVIGNAIGYSSTFEIEGSGAFKTPEIENVSFRNGLAYQVPVGERVFGRLGTLRASYAYTTLAGDDLFVDEYHDLSLSYGFATREASVRQIAEAARIGASATFGDDFEAYTLNVGYRF